MSAADETNARGETFEAFTKRIQASAASIAIVRGQQRTTLDKLSERDRLANIDRWWLEGTEPPLVGTLANPSVPPPTTLEKRAATNVYPVTPGAEVERFVGWVQRKDPNGPGYEFAEVELPRHVVEACSVPDHHQRRIRKDLRQVMNDWMLARLASWNLGRRTA